MRILLLEPFMGESHKDWAEGLARHSRHDIQVMGLPGRHWKWRMHGAAETFAKQLAALDAPPDLILASDMLDVAGFLGLSRKHTASIPVAVYFHENQLAYPWSPDDPDPKLQRDNHYAFINYRSALAADRVFFNSSYNMESFLEGLGPFLAAFPDHQELQNIGLIRAKSAVLPLGLDLARFDAHKPAQKLDGPPIILWNHRWEYDKDPETFFRVLMQLADEGHSFRLVVLGRSYTKQPKIFEEAKAILAERILHWGFAESFAEYAQWLWQADILPVTSKQEFFGASVVEAMYCGCMPLLPNALSYPGHIPAEKHSQLLYRDENALLQHLRTCLSEGLPELQPSDWISGYDWKACISAYDLAFDKLALKS